MIQLTTSQHYTADCTDLRAGKRSHSTSSSRTGRDLARPLERLRLVGEFFLFLTSYSSSSCLVLPGHAAAPEWIIFHLSLLRSLMRTLMDYSSRGWPWRRLIKQPFRTPSRAETGPSLHWHYCLTQCWWEEECQTFCPPEMQNLQRKQWFGQILLMHFCGKYFSRVLWFIASELLSLVEGFIINRNWLNTSSRSFLPQYLDLNLRFRKWTKTKIRQKKTRKQHSSWATWKDVKSSTFRMWLDKSNLIFVFKLVELS